MSNEANEQVLERIRDLASEMALLKEQMDPEHTVGQRMILNAIARDAQLLINARLAAPDTVAHEIDQREARGDYDNLGPGLTHAEVKQRYAPDTAAEANNKKEEQMDPNIWQGCEATISLWSGGRWPEQHCHKPRGDHQEHEAIAQDGEPFVRWTDDIAYRRDLRDQDIEKAFSEGKDG